MNKSTLSALVFMGFTLVSCQKDLNFTDDQPTTPDQNQNGQLIRIQQGTNPDIIEDTVYLLSYNSSNRLTQVVDSIYEDTLNINYNSAGNIIHGDWSYSGNESNYSYNNNQQLEEINCRVFGLTERMTFEYTNGVISKASYYTDPGGTGNASLLWQTYQFTVSAGNVTNLKIYDRDNTLTSNLSFTYGTQLNPFKNLALLNIKDNYLGMMDLLGMNTIFSENICNSYSNSIGLAINSTQYTFNSNQQPTKAICNTVYSYIYTWLFQYK